MNQDTIYRGLMRPPTVLGVPMMPIMLVQGGLLLCFFFFSANFIWIMFLAHMVMRLLMKQDEQIFELIGVRLLTWAQSRGVNRSGRNSVVLTALR